MSNNKELIIEMIDNINWLLEAHNSHVELVEIMGSKIVLRYEGQCSACKIDCAAFAINMTMPDMKIIKIK